MVEIIIQKHIIPKSAHSETNRSNTAQTITGNPQRYRIAGDGLLTISGRRDNICISLKKEKRRYQAMLSLRDRSIRG